MARRIEWNEPELTTVTQIKIKRSATLYGTYSTIDTIAATSDGQPKDATNIWVTEYTDVNGERTDWYKISFYDSSSTTWSEDSDPVTSEELIRLCTVDDVKKIINTTGRWSDDEIFNMITEVDDMIYIESGTPIQAAWSVQGKIDNTFQDTFYVGEENIYRVDRVFYGTTTMHEYFLDDGYKTNLRYGMVRLLSVASGGPTLADNNYIEVHYVPRIYHLLSLYRTIVRLLEQVDITADGAASKELSVAKSKLDKIETLLAHRIGLQVSSDLKYYDSLYGVNRRKVTQDHIRNNYIGSYGWD